MKTTNLKTLITFLVVIILTFILTKQVGAKDYYTIYMDSVNFGDTIIICSDYDSLKFVPMKAFKDPSWYFGQWPDSISSDTLYLEKNFTGNVTCFYWASKTEWKYKYIYVSPLLKATTNDIVVSCGKTAQLNVTTNYSGSGILTYLWKPSAGLSAVDIANPEASLLSKAVYSVEVTTPNGCTVKDTANINTSVISDNPLICLVTVDENDKNNIIIQKEMSDAIESYLIYRESSLQTDQYDLIGIVPYIDNAVFNDSQSNAKIQSNIYKIAIKDVCGFVTEKSEKHKTLHLTINKGTGNNWNLIWEAYIGVPISNYKIYRGTTKSDLVEIGITSGHITSFTDINAPSGNIYYQVEGTLTHACSSLKSTLYETVRSNLISNFDLSKRENAIPETKEFIYPNPADDIVFLRSGISMTGSLYIYNMQGRLVLTKEVSEQIDISTLSNGIYIVKFINSGNVLINKFVKE